MANEDFFTKEQWSIIIGSLLGDGCINKTKYGNSSLTKPQCAAHFDYLKWHKDIFKEKCGEVKTGLNRAAGKNYVRHQLRWRSHFIFTELRSKWYPNGKKIVPFDLELDPLAVAIWFFDDGSNYVKKRVVKFATYCFQRCEVEFLCQQLEQKFSIKTCISKRNEIFVKTESYKIIVDLVKPYMLWPCFEHKIVYRDSQLKFTSDQEALEMIALYSKGQKLADIANKFDCSISVVSAMVRGERKKHLHQNKPVVALNNKSGHTGICFDKQRNKWLASVKVDGKSKNLGRFASKEEAISVRQSFLRGLVR